MATANLEQQQRGLLLFIPIPAVIFLTVIFFIFDGGGTKESAQQAESSGELSIEVPGGQDATNTIQDKVSAYLGAQQARNERNLRSKKDNHLKWLLGDSATTEDPFAGRGYLKNPNELAFKPEEMVKDMDEQGKQIDEQLAQLEKQMATRSPAPRLPAPAPETGPSNEELLARLQAYENAKALPPSQAEEESILGDDFSQLSGMLDKVLDIQHPDRVAERQREMSLENRGEFYTVSTQEHHLPVSYLGDKKEAIYQDRFQKFIDDQQDSTYRVINQQSISGFMGLSTGADAPDENTVRAMVHGTQEVIAGSTVKLRLLSPIMVAGHLVPANSFIYGTASFNQDRLQVFINSLKADQTVLPVAMNIYDQDGLPGISIPGIATTEAARRTAGQATSAMQLRMSDPTIQGRALEEGVQGLRQLLRRQAQVTKATLKSNYEVLLLNQKTI